LEQSTQIHHACLSFVIVHQMAPPLSEIGDIQLQLTTHISTPKGIKGWVGLVGLHYSGRFTHISGHRSATGHAQDRESSPANDRRSTAVPRHQLWCSLIYLGSYRLVVSMLVSSYGTRQYCRRQQTSLRWRCGIARWLNVNPVNAKLTSPTYVYQCIFLSSATFVKNLKFQKSKMAAAAILKNPKSRYLDNAAFTMKRNWSQFLFLYVCMYVCMYVCTCMHACMYVFMLKNEPCLIISCLLQKFQIISLISWSPQWRLSH